MKIWYIFLIFIIVKNFIKKSNKIEIRFVNNKIEIIVIFKKLNRLFYPN